jgi:hypothetical protein
MTFTYLIARTAYGAPIECFSSRERADLWIETEGHKFPGWQLEIRTERTMTFRAILAADDSQAVAA